MQNKETALQSIQNNIALNNDDYYKYIFKKTEKIACAVFYIFHRQEDLGQNDTVIYDLEDTARTLLDVSLESLRCRTQSMSRNAEDVRFALITLESKLRLSHAAGILQTEHLDVFLHEIESVQRSLRSYLEPSMQNPLANDPIESTPPQVRRTIRKEIQTSQQSYPVPSTGQSKSRTDRILDVLKEKGLATIKDVSDVVTDCSEKTIQRELISLIDGGIVKREGERRWSKYSLI